MQLFPPRAAADDPHGEVVEVAQEAQAPDERVEVLRVADVARVHDDEALHEAGARGPRGCPRGCGVDRSRRRSSSGSRGSARLGRPSPRAAASSCRRSRRRGRPSGSDESTSRRSARSTNGLWRRPSLTAISGNTSCAITSSGTRKRARDEPADGADERRVGHADDEVRATPEDGLPEDADDVGEVVRPAPGEPCALVGGRANTHDLDAVSHLAWRHVGRDAGDDGARRTRRRAPRRAR